MNLEFPVIVKLAKHLIQDRLGLDRNLTDSEIATLQCVWDSIDHREFEKHPLKFTHKYRNLYRFPEKTKKVSTLVSNLSKLLKYFSSIYFDDENEKLTRYNFKRKITELFELNVLDIRKFSNFSDEEISDISNFEAVSTVKNEINFVGRDNDMKVIKNAVYQYPITSIYGVSGVGKTTLAKKMIDIFRNDYFVMYIDFHYIKDFFQWGHYILSSFNLNKSVTEDSLAGDLIDLLSNNKLLIIMDSLDYFHEDIKKFIESYLLKSEILSHFLLLSQIKISSNFEENKVFPYQLKGLENKDDINQFFNLMNLKKTKLWNDLCDYYGGNFRELIYVSRFIKDYFDGDVDSYWQIGSKILSPETTKNFSSLNFNKIDHKIFAMFAEDESIISAKILQVLRNDSKTGEIFARINYLSDFGYLIKHQSDKYISYTIAPLLKAYLIQEGLIDA